MEENLLRTPLTARRDASRRALSLLELVAVVAIIGVATVATASYYGFASLGNGGAEGFARKLSLALVHARRSTIATGENHYLQLNTSGGSVISYAHFRRTGGGDVQVDQTSGVPQGVTVTAVATTLEFDFDGSALAAYTVSIAGPDRSWSVSVTLLTGAVVVVETTP